MFKSQGAGAALVHHVDQGAYKLWTRAYKPNTATGTVIFSCGDSKSFGKVKLTLRTQRSLTR